MVAFQTAASLQKLEFYEASYESDFPAARYGMESANSPTGAVPLYRFVMMVKTRYRKERSLFRFHPIQYPLHAVRLPQHLVPGGDQPTIELLGDPAK